MGGDKDQGLQVGTQQQQLNIIAQEKI